MRSSGLGRYQIGEVSRSHIEAWIKRMADQPLAPGTIKTRYNNIRSVFRAAVRDRLLVRDPSESVRLPRQRSADAAMTIPTVEDVGALLTAAEPRFGASLHCARSQAFASGRRRHSRSVTSIFSGASSPSTGRCSGPAVDWSRSNLRSSARNDGIFLPDDLAHCCRSTSSATPSDERRTGGCSRASPATRRTRTPSATGGARPRRPPASTGSGCMICGTSPPRASSLQAATSSPCSARSGTRRPPRRCRPTPPVAHGRRPHSGRGGTDLMRSATSPELLRTLCGPERPRIAT